MTDFLSHALAWAARGFRVFPIVAESKTPRFAGWTESASADPAQITAWWRDPITGHLHDHNIGVLTTGLALIDLDTKGGKLGLLNYLDICGEFGTLTVRTPSGGLHLYFRTAAELANSQGDQGGIAPGIDLRGHHGFALAPGSVFGGGEYRIEVDAPVAELPGEVLALAQRAGQRKDREAVPSVEMDTPGALAAAASYLRQAPPALAGMGGNSRTLQTAYQARDRGVSEAGCFEAMLEHYNERCEPPWTPEELRAIVENAYRYAQNAEGAKAAEVDFGGIVIEPPAPAATLQEGAAAPNLAPQFSHVYLARLFAAKHGGALRFVPAWGRWMRYSGQLWEPDGTLRARAGDGSLPRRSLDVRQGASRPQRRKRQHDRRR